MVCGKSLCAPALTGNSGVRAPALTGNSGVRAPALIDSFIAISDGGFCSRYCYFTIWCKCMRIGEVWLLCCTFCKCSWLRIINSAIRIGVSDRLISISIQNFCPTGSLAHASRKPSIPYYIFRVNKVFLYYCLVIPYLNTMSSSSIEIKGA